MHTVYLGHHRQFVWLVVNSQKRIGGRTPGCFKALNVQPRLYVGIHPLVKDHSEKLLTSFKGIYFKTL